MTRQTVNARLRWVYLSIGLVLAISLGAALAPLIPGVPKLIVETSGKIYELIRDMSLLIATLAAAYLANVFQKRATFVSALEQEWRNIVRTKSSLYTFCEAPYPSAEQYLDAFCRLSETIDTMRVVYKNSGETDALIGLYPYAPLHDMRRALQSVDPRTRTTIPVAERRLVRDAILQSFYALRENFLEELDLEEPRHPLLIAGGRRLKVPGASARARARQSRERERQLSAKASVRPDIEELLARLYDLEQQGNRPEPVDKRKSTASH
ncbi:MAG: hypothetical protein NW217_01630 [Hyphomicrobiaceae bacterium]|nr:hypothetical protein [Hyphomicrobiaceae bacterium]